MKAIENSNELMDALRRARTEWLFLAGGDYAIDKLRAAGPIFLLGEGHSQTRVRLHGDLMPQHSSFFSELCFIHEDGIPILDNAALTTFERVAFRSPLPAQSHVKKMKWFEVEAKGIGVRVTNAANPDHSYKIKFRECFFDFFEIAVDIEPSPDRATTGWRFFDCESNGCREWLHGEHISDFYIHLGNVQLAQRGLFWRGNNNTLDWLHFERNECDVEIAEGFENYLVGVDARRDKVIDHATGTKWRLPRTHRNPRRPGK